MTNAAKAANAEPIPGYRLIEPLGSGGFGEVWKCEAPGGLFKAVKFVRGESDEIHQTGPAGADQELKALQHIKTLRHPFLLSMDRVEFIDGELVIVMELADRSLHDLLVECRESGLAGVPRAELLRYLAEAAEVLDLLNQEHGLQHLDVKPRNFFLVGRHVKVGDFGLVNSLAEMSGSTPSALQMGAVTPVYAAPESFLGKVTLFSDQYSLAITYHELLVGEPPFAGKNLRQLAMQHLQAEPDLGRLPESDRPMVARALAKEPRQRFPSCTAFVEALLTGDMNAPVGPPPSAPRKPKNATRTDVPVVNLTRTPVNTRLPSHKDTPPEVARETRPVRPAAPPVEPAGDAGASAGDPLAGCQFLECVARNPAGEAWTVRAADGRERLVRFVFGQDAADGKEGERLARLRALRHESVEPMDVLGGGSHRLAVVTDACPMTLATRLLECQSAGMSGVPRPELLDRMGEAAAALDALYEKHGVRHLGLNPRQMLLRNGRLRLLHFGLVELLHMPAGHPPGALNPRYSAPELFEGQVHAASDVYSLALIYYEMLTGAHPFRALSPRQMTSARRGQPDLGLAAAPDRVAVLSALEPDPSRRPARCADFIAALESGGRPRRVGGSRTTIAVPGAGADLSLTPATRMLIRQAVSGLVAAAAGSLEVREYKNIRSLLHPGQSLEHQFFARLGPGVAKARLEGFRHEWHATLAKSDGHRFSLVVSLSGAAWQRWLGTQPGLRVDIDAPPPEAAGGMTEVQVRIEPVRCAGDLAARSLEETGPQLLESLRTYFQALPERRNQARLRFERPVRVRPVLADQTRGESILSQSRDISLRGIGLTLPCRPPSMLLTVRLPGLAPGQELDVPGCIVRAIPGRDGSYDVGVRFLLDEGKAEAE